MKASIKFLSLFLLAVLFSIGCQKDKIDVAGLTDFPPGILSISPGDNSKVVIGDFNIVVVFVDGTTSPLSTATVSLKDAAGTQLTTVTKSLSGIRDSVVIAGSEFNASSLGVGFYTLTISVSDASGQALSEETTFEISTLPFPANNEKMYLAGAFNGWGADELTLVAPYTWELKNVSIEGEWKLKNCADWCDQDWGDPDCDGLVQNTTGGGPNSACGSGGLVNFRFNDQTLQYTMAPAVNFAANVSALYLLGSFNDFQGEEYRFTLTGDNTWELDEILLGPGDTYKFSEGPFFMGKNYGDADGDGVAELFGPNIVVPDGQQQAFYSIVFNDRTLAYELTFIRFPSIGIIGSATPGGWDSDTDMTDNGDGTFSINIELVDGEAKFRANDDWAVNWGAADFPSGIGVLNGPNIPVTAGKYDVTFNPETGEYNFELDAGFGSIGIIGSATPGGWDSDTDMNDDDGDGIYTLLIGLGDGEAKFRADNDWVDNWGATGFPSGTGTLNGPNIPVPAGIYLVTFNSNTGEYNFAPASIGIIGSATPGGWDSDTDMTVNPSVIGEVMVMITLTDGEAKFRLNDDWAINWGAATFPMGIGTQNGPNIPVTGGTYTVRFNVNTGMYSFE